MSDSLARVLREMDAKATNGPWMIEPAASGTASTKRKDSAWHRDSRA